jgi:hypothetical protein
MGLLDAGLSQSLRAVMDGITPGLEEKKTA